MKGKIDRNRFGVVVYVEEGGVEVPYIKFRTKKKEMLRLREGTHECEIGKIHGIFIPRRLRSYHSGLISVMPRHENLSQNGSTKKLSLRAFLFCKGLEIYHVDFSEIRANLYVYLPATPQEENRD